MSYESFDAIVVGQGLAGSLLAWFLTWQGRRVLVIDRGDEGSSSRVAAGLMTPITGRRLVLSWRWDEFLATAESAYRRIETETGARFYDPMSIVRLLADSTEQEFLQRRLESDSRSRIELAQPLVDSDWFRADLGGFAMQGARLNVRTFLAATRRFLEQQGAFLSAEFDPECDVELTPKGVRLARWNVTASYLVFCQGIHGLTNPWFANLRFKPARGEILTVRVPELREPRTITRGVWLTPLGDERFRVGATYDWQSLGGQPTLEGRQELVSRLAEFLKRPVEVQDQAAAVRPILRHQFPEMGQHQRWPQLVVLNGLGSKGSLQAPWLAEHLAASLFLGEPIDPSVRCRLDAVSSPGELP